MATGMVETQAKELKCTLSLMRSHACSLAACVVFFVYLSLSLSLSISLSLSLCLSLSLSLSKNRLIHNAKGNTL